MGLSVPALQFRLSGQMLDARGPCVQSLLETYLVELNGNVAVQEDNAYRRNRRLGVSLISISTLD